MHAVLNGSCVRDGPAAEHSWLSRAASVQEDESERVPEPEAVVQVGLMSVTSCTERAVAASDRIQAPLAQRLLSDADRHACTPTAAASTPNS